METFKESLIVASTAHLSLDLMGMLLSSRSIPGFYVDSIEYGWLCTRSEDFEPESYNGTKFDDSTRRNACVAQLRVIWDFVAKMGCRRILFDQDADEIPDLPVFEHV